MTPWRPLLNWTAASALLAIVIPAVRAADLTVTVMPESSATYPAGTTIRSVTSQSDDPLAPLRNVSVFFRGFASGGSSETRNGAHLVYRLRLDFHTPVFQYGLGGFTLLQSPHD